MEPAKAKAPTVPQATMQAEKVAKPTMGPPSQPSKAKKSMNIVKVIDDRFIFV
jgi:hypothetical protein